MSRGVIMFDKNNLSTRIYNLRKNEGISQAALGESVGVSLHTISKIEKGERAASIEVLTALADYFDVPLDYLVGRGIFENWEQVMKYKDIILKGLEKSFGKSSWDFNVMSEKDLIRLLPAFISKIEIDEKSNKVDVVFYE